MLSIIYLREDNFGLKIEKNVALKITCKIVAFVYRKLPFSLTVSLLLENMKEIYSLNRHYEDPLKAPPKCSYLAPRGRFFWE